MVVIVALLALLTRFDYTDCVRPCVPNTIFRVNGQQCRCDASGSYTERSCTTASFPRSNTCKPGQVIKDGCYECVCTVNGEFICNNKNCPLKSNNPTRVVKTKINSGLSVIGNFCNPLKSYYVNCSICICPSNGVTANAICIPQRICLTQFPHLSTQSSKDVRKCIPNVIYVYNNCLQCSCSDDSSFDLKNCENYCSQTIINKNNTCNPKTFYKKPCYVCFCPEDGIKDPKYCAPSACDSKRSFKSLQSMIDESDKCEPHKFSNPKCFYCDCGSDGKANENSCFMMECMKTLTYDEYSAKNSCTSDVIPYCMSCFCIQSGYINYKYCAKSCSLHSKLNILQVVLKDSFLIEGLINPNIIRKDKLDPSCEPNTIFFESAKYCLCPNNGNTLHKICIAMKELVNLNKNQTPIDYNVKCQPLTFVDFGCNSCFCKADGHLDPKWCTFDDCEVKKAVLADQKKELGNKEKKTSNMADDRSCNPGSITKNECNFCICPENGKVKDIVCTKSHCSSKTKTVQGNIFCEPLSYYEIDCNICYCPRSGIKNVAKCTKNVCDNFLRSSNCNPGHIFSDTCNFCVCPPNGKKNEAVCTTRDCEGSDDHWNTIFKLSQSLTVPVVPSNSRVLDLCFPGEEFPDGCKTCICPDMGLRAYSICVDNCKENAQIQYNAYTGNKDSVEDDKEEQNPEEDGYYRKTKTKNGNCFNIDRRQISAYIFEDPSKPRMKAMRHRVRKTPEPRKACTPGSQYILNCKQCICPLRGNIYDYCRPLATKEYCVEDNLRRNANISADDLVSKMIEDTDISHTHTAYKCKTPGKVMDVCFVCDCDDVNNELVLEHCFKSSSQECVNATPTFLQPNVIRKAIFWK